MITGNQIKNLPQSVKAKIINLLEENIGKNIYDLGVSKEKEKSTNNKKKKVIILDFIKRTNFALWNTIK